jgi:hypothetical protein
LVSAYKSTRRQNPEDHHGHLMSHHLPLERPYSNFVTLDDIGDFHVEGCRWGSHTKAPGFITCGDLTEEVLMGSSHCSCARILGMMYWQTQYSFRPLPGLV